MNSVQFRVPVHIEVKIKASSIARQGDIEKLVREKLSQQCPVFANGPVIFEDLEEGTLFQFVEAINVCDLFDGQRVSFWQADVVGKLI